MRHSPSEAVAAIAAIAKAVAGREDREPDVIRKEIRQRVAVVVARSTASMIVRRQRRTAAERPQWAAAGVAALSNTGIDNPYPQLITLPLLLKFLFF